MLMFTIRKVTGQKKWLPFVTFLLFLCGMQITEARTLDDPDTTVHKQWHEIPHLNEFSVQFFTKDATCYDNGKVGFILVRSTNTGKVRPINQDELDSLMLDDFGIGQKGTLLDTSMHWHRGLQYNVGDTTWVNIEPGTFDITLEFTHRHSNNEFWIVDTTQTNLTVNLLYHEPVISVLSVAATQAEQLGNIPSLDCYPTGRIQLSIQHGRFPYTIKYVKHGSLDTLTAVFDTYQHTGNVETQSDYHDYYTIDSLGSGLWDFYMVDGCQYGMPRVSQTVNEVAMPQLKRVEIVASSGNISDNNVLRINAVLNDDYLSYYGKLFQPYMEYRFLVDSLQEDGNITVPWQEFPYNGKQKVQLTETISKAANYCQIYGKDIKFVLRMRENPYSAACPLEDDTVTFQIKKPNVKYYTPNEFDQIEDSIVSTGECGSMVYLHNDNYYIQYKDNDPNHVEPDTDHVYKRYHITYPLYWKYIDQSNMLIKTDTIYNSIATRTHFLREELLSVIPTATGMRTIIRQLEDANGCPLYNDNFRIMVYTSSRPSEKPVWKILADDPSCCSKTRYFRIFEQFGKPAENYDGVTIQLVDGPEDNLYGFTAVYVAATSSWHVTRNKGFLNQAIFEGPTGAELKISKTCLPSGTYKFRIFNAPCQDDTIYLTKYLQEIIYPEFIDEPVFEVLPGCSESFVVCTQGQIGLAKDYRRKNVPPDQLDVLIHEVTPLGTYIRLVNGPIGGFSTSDMRDYHIGDSIRITVPTDDEHPYVFELHTHESVSDICEEIVYYDTVYYDGSTVRFDFAMALVCDTTYSEGTVYVRGYHGKPPYHYRLFSEPNLEGTMIEEVTLGKGVVAQFDDVLMNTDQQLSCEITDSCGATFHVNFFPQSLAELQKLWFDGGLSTIETCEGSYVTIHALQAGLIFNYIWFIGDDTIPAWESSDPTIFIPRGADTSVYRVEITQTGCQHKMTDSVTVYPLVAPYLSINNSLDIEVCPGDTGIISFTPYSATGSDVSFDVYFDNVAGREVRHYVSPSGQTVTDKYMSFYNTKIYPKSIVDVQCDYGMADPNDTIHYLIVNNNVNPCHINTTHDTVCISYTATLTASCTETPGIIRWYSDFALTDTLSEEMLLHSTQQSYYYLDNMEKYTALFVNVEKPGFCPANNLIGNGSVNMALSDTTHLTCTDAYYFYDDGGILGDYSTTFNYQEHMFVSHAPGHPVTMHINTLDLSPTSYLFVFTGSQAITDSMLISLEAGSAPPDVLVSSGDTMLVVFMPGQISSSGWDAMVRPAPGIAIADVYDQAYVILRDTVCQNHRSGHECYDDSKWNFLGDDENLWSMVEQDVQTAGRYSYEKRQPGSNGCDSITVLILLVKMPPYGVMDAVVLSVDTPYFWNGLPCSSTKQYIATLSGDCGDSLAILNLVVLNVDTTTNEICYPASTDMGIKVYTPDMKYFDPRISVGDVLCTDGSVLRVDSFLISGKEAKGVVFAIDTGDVTHRHGRAVALYDAYNSDCIWSPQSEASTVHSAYCATYTNVAPHVTAMEDMGGYENSLHIEASAGGYPSVKTNAPACYYCLYYNHLDPKNYKGSAQYGWYLPSLGELNLLYANRFEVSATLKILSDLDKAEMMLDHHFYYKGHYPDTKYWSSTECYSNNDGYGAYSFSSNGQLNNRNKKWFNSDNPRYVRAVIEFTIQ